jgi:hypothetical protein
MFSSLPIRSRLSHTIAALGLIAIPSIATAQLPGVPVLQNAFGNPGLTVAGNAGFGSGNSAYALAMSFAPGSGRFQFSGGAGLYSPQNGSGRGAWGLRGAGALFSAMGGAVGIGAFAGIGGAGGGGVNAGTPAGQSPGAESVSWIPVGASVGYRHALGTTRGISVYAAPIFSWYSRGGDNSTSGTVFRVSAGVDFGLTRAFGVTAGAEFGQSADDNSLGPNGTSFGIGLSYALGAR